MVSEASTQRDATLFFGVLLLLFVQTLTLWFDSIYKIALTRLSMGKELLVLLFLLLPLVVAVLPAGSQRRALWGSIILFLAARAIVPLTGVVEGAVIAGVAVGAFLIALCFILSGPFRFLQGDVGVALGMATMLSITIRAWGATYDFSLGPSGAWLGWVFVGVAAWLCWRLRSLPSDPPPQWQSTWREVFGPALSLFANIAIVYLVLFSPGVVEAWLGFDNTYGVLSLLVTLGCVVVWMLQRGRGTLRITRRLLVLWNLGFAAALVGGILALRIEFPATPEAAAVIVTPENATARLLLNLMFLLSPVVLLNMQAACRGLQETDNVRALSLSVFMGMTLLTLVTVASIFSNTWGYAGKVSMIFRNQFHLPFVFATGMMTATLFLPGWRSAFAETQNCPRNAYLVGLTGLLMLIGVAGTWHYRPVASQTTPNAKQLTILSYNLQQGAALGGNRNWENQLALLRAIDADVIGLQESDTPRPSNGNVLAAKYFGAKLGYHIYYGPNTVSGTYGTAILSRFPLRKQRTFFTFSDEDEVGTAAAEFDAGGQTIAFFNSHPSGSVPRKCHALELVRQAAACEHVIAVGDYNSRPRDEAYRIVARVLKDSWIEKHPDGVGPLHPTLRPQGATLGLHDSSSGQVSESGDTIAVPDRIDHIFISRSFRVLEDYFLPAPASQTDHPAHWSIVTFNSTLPITRANQARNQN